MEATLSFKLPEEDDEYKLANKALDFYCALFRLDEELRGIRKYHSEDYDVDTIDKVYTIFYESLAMYDINLDMVS